MIPVNQAKDHIQRKLEKTADEYYQEYPEQAPFVNVFKHFPNVQDLNDQ